MKEVLKLCRKLQLDRKLRIPADILADIIAGNFSIDEQSGLNPIDAASNAIVAILFEAGERNRQFEGIDLELVEAEFAKCYAERLSKRKIDRTNVSPVQ